MKKTLEPSNHRLVVFIAGRSFGRTPPREMYQNCKDVEAQIKRHCDGFTSIDIEVDHDDVCDFCEASWTEVSDQYNGGCCDEDEKNNPNPIKD